MMMMLGMLSAAVFGQQLTIASNPLTQTSVGSNQNNYVSNGDFSSCSCQTTRCPFSGNNVLNGWTADSQVEVGYGNSYNNYLGNERVVSLSNNNCVKQQLNYLAPGNYNLVIQYSARQDQQLSDCQFGVSLNGNPLKTICPSNYQVNT